MNENRLAAWRSEHVGIINPVRLPWACCRADPADT
jgi:hypothetical protein